MVTLTFGCRIPLWVLPAAGLYIRYLAILSLFMPVNVEVETTRIGRFIARNIKIEVRNGMVQQ